MGVYLWVDTGPLCFTANTASSTVTLNKTGTPTEVSLETSTDGSNWSSYTIGDTITLSSIGDKVYFRNTSETDTGFSTGWGSYYKFAMTGSIAGSGDITSLINKNGTDTLSNFCFYDLFLSNSSLTTAPDVLVKTVGERSCYEMFGLCGNLTKPSRLPATTLGVACYQSMFTNCPSLNILPKLPATTLPANCYQQMFAYCSNIKLSTTQTGAYQTAYRIPTTGTGTDGGSSLYTMFTSTGGTRTGAPTINTTYYTSNTVI